MATSWIYMTSMKDCCLARLGEGLDFDKYSCVVTVRHTGVVVQVVKVPEEILDRVTESTVVQPVGRSSGRGSTLHMWWISFSMYWSVQDSLDTVVYRLIQCCTCLSNCMLL